MSTLSVKTTIYLDPQVKKFLQSKAFTEGRSISSIINEQFEDMIEDLSDIKEINKRRGEETFPFETALEEIGLSCS